MGPAVRSIGWIGIDSVKKRTQRALCALHGSSTCADGTEAFSQAGLIAQLDSPDGGGYSVNDATVAVDSLTTDWNAEAVQAAKQYMQLEPMSCSDLIQQLDSPDGDQYTVAQATYGAQQAGDC